MAAAARTRKSFFITNWFGLYSACLPACKIGAKVGKLSPRPKLFGLKFPKIVLNGIGLAELAGSAPRSLREWIPIYNKRRRGRRGVVAGSSGLRGRRSVTAGPAGGGVEGAGDCRGCQGLRGCRGGRMFGDSRVFEATPQRAVDFRGRDFRGRGPEIAGAAGWGCRVVGPPVGSSGSPGLSGRRVSGVIGAAGLRGCRVVGSPEMSKTRSLAGLVFIFWRCRLRAPCPGSARPVRGPPS